LFDVAAQQVVFKMGAKRQEIRVSRYTARSIVAPLVSSTSLKEWFTGPDRKVRACFSCAAIAAFWAADRTRFQ
jgi:hypothetical protein